MRTPLRALIFAVPFLLMARRPAGAGENKLPAFPGAEGFGAVSVGGRGGKVIKVTNLNPKGPGSLQAACSASGPRMVVFDVSGVIPGHLRIKHGQITIAGSTAPGAGITVHGRMLCHGPMKDVIVRFLRIRPKPPRGHSGGKDGVQFGGIEGLIFDHVSASWGGDETLSATNCGPMTIQWCAVEESALVSEGGVSPHNFGTLIGYTEKPMSVHHTLYAHHSDRFPQITSGKGMIDVRNNVAYNCGGSCAGVNVIGCYFKEGPGGAHGRRSNIAPFALATSTGVASSVLGSKVKTYAGDNYSDLAGGYAHGTSARARRRRAEKPNDAAPVKTHPAEQAYELVLAHAGGLPRDEVLRRTVREVRTGTGSWGAVMPEDGLLAGLKPGKAPADADKDGMPDEWEKAHKLDPNDPKDAVKIVPAGASRGDRHKGYTYIEHYINERADMLVAQAIAQARAAEKPPARPRPVEHTPWSTAQPGAKTDSPEVDKYIAILQKGKTRGVAKWRAARKLCYHHRPTSAKAAGAIAELVKHEDIESRRCVSWVIGCMEKPPKEAIAPLVETMLSDDGVKGGGCFQAWALARIGPDAAELAVPAFQKVKDHWAKWPVAYALSRMGPKAKEAMPFLVKLLGVRNSQVQYMSAKALAGLGADAVSALSGALGARRGGGKAYAALALAWMGPKAKGAAGALVKALGDAEPSVRRRAALALASIGPEVPEVLPALTRALKDQSWYVRHQAAKGLALIGPKAKGAAGALAEALKDGEFMVRGAAAEALGRIGSAAGSKAKDLIAVLKGDKHFWPRLCAARALGRLGPEAKEWVSALAEALADPDAEVRQEAAWALAAIGPAAKSAAGALEKALSDGDYVVSFAAAKALKRIK